jgi:hypothetical protein
VNKINAKEIYDAVTSQKAAITFAVSQFSDNPKLKAYKEDKDLLKLLESFDNEEDPFILQDMPPIGNVRQLLVLSKNTTLPFGEKGVIQKHGNEEIAKHILREQLEVYAKEYPWTKPMIDKGLKKAATGCRGCGEKHLLQRVAQMVKDQLVSTGPAPTLDEMSEETGAAIEAGLAIPKVMSVEEAKAVRPGHYFRTWDAYSDQDQDKDPAMWGAREPCPMCTLKHLSQAIVLMNESITGYPIHRWYAVGHIAEAEAESPTQEMANRIRMIRLDVMDDLDFIPDFTEIVTELDSLVRGHIVPQ